MNLSKLFPVQKVLDERIMDKHPELKGQNNLDWKILALQVELGECANEWRGFKKWSHDQNPRTREILVQCDLCREWTDYTHEVEGITVTKNSLLEEYVDCLHFILSIGLELEININLVYSPEAYIFGDDITKTLTHLIGDAAMLNSGFEEIEEQEYNMYVNHFMYLGKLLGFTWEQVFEAYMSKNAVNHTRQLNGY